MSVAQNLRYGRFFTPKAERYADFGQVVELLGIGDLLERRPGLLSGGEKQRVAIGRALIAMIAGLIRPQRGRISVDGRVLVDTQAGVFVPGHRRRSAMPTWARW
jgi:ABC-type molybdate transport system ATPase subunit